MDTAEFFHAKPVFTSRDLDDHLGRASCEASRDRGAILARLKRDGRIVRVRRGLFAAVPEGESAEGCGIDHLLVASRLTPDAVVTHGSALECLGLAEGPAGEAVYSAVRPLNPIVLRGRLYRGVKFPKSLVRGGSQLLEVKTVERGGSRLSVATAERALVDLIDRPDLSGGWAATVALLARLERLDLAAVVAYTRALANSTTAAKVGWYLAGRREAFPGSERHLAELSALRPNQPHYLDRSRRRDGRLVADWNLIVGHDQ
jgi:predicted transcriptional regulator of viral defense system